MTQVYFKILHNNQPEKYKMIEYQSRVKSVYCFHHCFFISTNHLHIKVWSIMESFVPKKKIMQITSCTLDVEASTVNLHNHYPLLVPECRYQARLFLTDIFAIPSDYSTRGISRLKWTVEGDLIYRIKNRIIFWDLTNPSAGNFRCLIIPAQRPNEHATYIIWLPDVEKRAFVGVLKAYRRDRTFCSHRGIDETFRSLLKYSAWFHINISLVHTSAFWCRDLIP